MEPKLNLALVRSKIDCARQMGWSIDAKDIDWLIERVELLERFYPVQIGYDNDYYKKALEKKE